MTIYHKPGNTTETNAAHPSLGKAGTREHVEDVLESIKGANLTATIKALNGIERGSYRVVITVDREYNEIQVRLKDGPAARVAVATGYVDRGHTKDDWFMAAAEVCGLVRAYLCR